MMVIFLTGLVSMILMRTLRNDYAKYSREEDDLETLVGLMRQWPSFFCRLLPLDMHLRVFDGPNHLWGQGFIPCVLSDVATSHQHL